MVLGLGLPICSISPAIMPNIFPLICFVVALVDVKPLIITILLPWLLACLSYHGCLLVGLSKRRRFVDKRTGAHCLLAYHTMAACLLIICGCLLAYHMWLLACLSYASWLLMVAWLLIMVAVHLLRLGNPNLLPIIKLLCLLA